MMDNEANLFIPEKGIPGEELLKELKSLQKNDVAWKDGRTWSLVYHAGEEHDKVIREAYSEFFSANYLNPFAFKSLMKMEAEVVRMTAGMLHGSAEVCGTMTSGGTESILLAVYTCREFARSKKPGITRPEIVVPISAHPAFDKAAHLFGLKIVKAPLDRNQIVRPDALQKLINRNTILLAASAPNYHAGTLDPIESIGRIAQEHKVPFHVDACMGGFMLPWLEKSGAPLEAWDFRVPGVTSISADVHKFGYGAKGASVILYKSMDLLRHQFFITTEFPGGIYASPTLLGTRPGGAIAAAWASMKHLGQEGYTKLAKQTFEAANRLRDLLLQLPEVEILGKPCMNILAIRTKNNKPDIFAVAEELELKGWMIDRQQLPDSLHLTVYPTNLPVIEKFAEDAGRVIKALKDHPNNSEKGSAALYGLMARLPFRGAVKGQVLKLLENMYSGSDSHSDVDLMNIATPPSWTKWANRILKFFGRGK